MRVLLSGKPGTVHDALFRAFLADPVQVQALLRDHLPNRIAGLLADKPPKIQDGSFVDEVLRNSQSDLLIEVELAAGGPAFIYVLAEHKSYPDPGVVLQLASYMVRIWIRHAQGKAERLRALPPIIPLVLYSGQSRWTVPDGLAGMIASDDPDLVCLPGERFIFRWLTEMEPGDLSSDALLQAGFVTLTRRGLKFLKPVVEALEENPVLRKLVREYIVQTYSEARLADLDEAGVSEMEGFVGTIAETLEARGEARGIAKGEALGIAKGEALGIAKGRAEGRKQDLIRLLERRFGPLPQAARKRIADADQLDGWIDRVLDATSLEAALGDG